jgi:hypothetical protein
VSELGKVSQASKELESPSGTVWLGWREMEKRRFRSEALAGDKQSRAAAGDAGDGGMRSDRESCVNSKWTRSWQV